MEYDDLLKQLFEKIHELGWDYSRLSGSGKIVYNEICEIVDLLNRL